MDSACMFCGHVGTCGTVCSHQMNASAPWPPADLAYEDAATDDVAKWRDRLTEAMAARERVEAERDRLLRYWQRPTACAKCGKRYAPPVGLFGTNECACECGCYTAVSLDELQREREMLRERVRLAEEWLEADDAWIAVGFGEEFAREKHDCSVDMCNAREAFRASKGGE